MTAQGAAVFNRRWGFGQFRRPRRPGGMIQTNWLKPEVDGKAWARVIGITRRAAVVVADPRPVHVSRPVEVGGSIGVTSICVAIHGTFAVIVIADVPVTITGLRLRRERHEPNECEDREEECFHRSRFSTQAGAVHSNGAAEIWRAAPPSPPIAAFGSKPASTRRRRSGALQAERAHLQMKLRILPVRPAAGAAEGRTTKLDVTLLVLLEANVPADEQMLTDFAETEPDPTTTIA